MLPAAFERALSESYFNINAGTQSLTAVGRPALEGKQFRMNLKNISYLIVGILIGMLSFGLIYALRSDGSPTIKHDRSLLVPQPFISSANVQSSSPRQLSSVVPTHSNLNIGSSLPSYRYNTQGELQNIVYSDGSVYTYWYDRHGDKIRETDGKTGKSWTYIYDKDHHPVRLIDPEGRITRPAAPIPN